MHNTVGGGGLTFAQMPRQTTTSFWDKLCCLRGGPTWIAEALVAGAHAPAHAVSTRAEGTEVHKLGTRGPCEAGAAAAGEVHTVRVAGAIVLAWRRRARVHLLFTGRAEVPCGRA